MAQRTAERPERPEAEEENAQAGWCGRRQGRWTYSSSSLHERLDGVKRIGVGSPFQPREDLHEDVGAIGDMVGVAVVAAPVKHKPTH